MVFKEILIKFVETKESADVIYRRIDKIFKGHIISSKLMVHQAVVV